MDNRFFNEDHISQVPALELLQKAGVRLSRPGGDFLWARRRLTA